MFGPALDRDFLLIALQPLLCRQNTLLNVPFGELTVCHSRTIFGFVYIGNVGVVYPAIVIWEDSCYVERVDLIADSVFAYIRLLVPNVYVKPWVDLVLPTWLHLERGHFILAIVCVNVVLSAELFIRVNICSTVFGQHYAVVPLIPHAARAVGCKYLSWMRASPSVNTLRQLRAGIGLREKFVCSFAIMVCLIRTEQLGPLRSEVILRFCAVARRDKSLNHVLAAIVSLLRIAWHNLTWPKHEVLFCYVVHTLNWDRFNLAFLIIIKWTRGKVFVLFGFVITLRVSLAVLIAVCQQLLFTDFAPRENICNLVLPFHRRLGLVLSLVVVCQLWEIWGCLCAHHLKIKKRVADSIWIVVFLNIVYDFVLSELPASFDLAFFQLVFFLLHLILHIKPRQCCSCAASKFSI